MKPIKDKEVDLSEYEAFGDELQSLAWFLDEVYSIIKWIYLSPG